MSRAYDRVKGGGWENSIAALDFTGHVFVPIDAVLATTPHTVTIIDALWHRLGSRCLQVHRRWTGS